MKDLKNVVDIVTFFNSENDRNVDTLGKVYSNDEVLKEAVHKLFTTHFKRHDIEGKSILIKPNWVREEIKDSDYLCLRTNDNLLIALLGEVLDLHPSKILIADAPIQGCDWRKMITSEFVSRIDALHEKYGIPIDVKDFRRTITDVSKNNVSTDLHPLSEYVIFNVGKESWLEPITTDKNRFRVTCYNPDRLAEVHYRGVHKYCITKDVFDYDVIITMPKLKTHRMAGMTNALKLLVGINGDKDYLPHHRVGSLKQGGDNYKDYSTLRSMANSLTDIGNRHRGTLFSKILLRTGTVLWKLSMPDNATIGNAGWYGNDTIWRTVLDLNKIALFGDSNGVIHKNQQRKLYTIMDGVVGGQGDGPLNPDPSPLGVLAYSNNPYLMDVVAGKLYHINIDKVPLLREAAKYVLKEDYSIFVNSKVVSFNDVEDFGIDIKMSPGWINYDKV